MTASSVVVNHRLNLKDRPRLGRNLHAFKDPPLMPAWLTSSLCFFISFFLLESLDLHIKMPAVLQETIYCVHILPPAINSLLLTLRQFVFSVASSASHMVSQLLLSSLAQNAEETILPANIQSQSSLNGPIMGPSPKAYFWQMLQNGCSLYCTFGYDLLTCRS